LIEKGSAAKDVTTRRAETKKQCSSSFTLSDRLFASATPRVQGEAPLHSEEAAYLERIDQRVRAIQTELAVLSAESISYAERLPTNNVASDVYQLSAALEQNRRLTRELVKEQAELELRVLEFRALRRSTARQNGTR
jgi:hypothetical protein